MKTKLIACVLLICSAAMADVVKVGLIIPQTGASAHIGEEALAAVKFFEQENKQLTLRHTYKVIVEDSQLQNRLTATAANKLIRNDKVAAVLSFGGGPAAVVKPLAQKYKVVHIAQTMDERASDGEYNFNHWGYLPDETHLLIEALKAKEVRSVAFLGMRHQATEACFNALKKLCSQSDIDIEILGEHYYNPGERDLRTPLQKATLGNPDILIINAIPPELDILLNHRKQMRIQTPLTCLNVFDWLEDLHSIDGFFWTSLPAAQDEFDKEFEHVTGKRATYATPYFYNALELIRTAAEAYETPESSDIATTLLALNGHDSALGPLHIEQNGYIWTPSSLYLAKDGKKNKITLENL